MSNNSTNKVDPIIKCYFVSLCTVMAVAFILTISNYCMLRGANKAPMNYTG